MRIYRIRAILDVLDDVFRDIEIKEEDTLEDLHNVINQSFGFDGSEMASFYISDEEWNQGEEIRLFDVGEGNSRLMSETKLNEVLSNSNTKLIYVYDFLSMWTFYVELADIANPVDTTDYPNLLFVQGQLPDSPPDKQFEAEKLDDYDEEFEDDFDNQDFENLDDYDFDQNWN
jgi:hypothetical protein